MHVKVSFVFFLYIYQLVFIHLPCVTRKEEIAVGNKGHQLIMNSTKEY